MLEEIVRNGLETNRGYRNPDKGIALRGPLSQLFSGLYLKPLDDAFNKMDVTYARFQDDVIILCKTKRQLNRCRRKMQEVLHERKLTLSRKKTKIGRVDQGFHFLGIDYPGTRTQSNTTGAANEGSVVTQERLMNVGVGAIPTIHCVPENIKTLPERNPHPRTFRNAREQVKFMISDGISTQKIRTYFING